MTSFVEQKTVPIDMVFGWDKNPRYIHDADKERLKRMLLRHGLIKPLIVFEEKGAYYVLGGNMRLASLKELVDEGHVQFSNIWVSIVKAETEEEKLKLAFADNDRAGHYDENKLVPMLAEIEGFPVEDYHIDTAYTVALSSVVDRYNMADVRARGGFSSDEEVDSNSVKDKKEIFDNASIKQIVLYFGKEEYDVVLNKLESIIDENELENNTDAFLHLLNYYENNRS